MEKKPLYRLMPLIGVVALCLFSGLHQCSTDTKNKDPEQVEPDKCGPRVIDHNVRFGSFYPNALAPEVHYNYVDNGWAFYTYTLSSVEDVCAHVHVNVEFRIQTWAEYGTDMTYEAEVMYGILYTYQVKDWNSDDVGNELFMTAKANFGMSFLYGDEPGYFFPILTIKVRDQGSPEANHSFFSEAIVSIEILSDYYRWKDNTGV